MFIGQGTTTFNSGSLWQSVVQFANKATCVCAVRVKVEIVWVGISEWSSALKTGTMTTPVVPVQRSWKAVGGTMIAVRVTWTAYTMNQVGWGGYPLWSGTNTSSGVTTSTQWRSLKWRFVRTETHVSLYWCVCYTTCKNTMTLTLCRGWHCELTKNKYEKRWSMQKRLC